MPLTRFERLDQDVASLSVFFGRLVLRVAIALSIIVAFVIVGAFVYHRVLRPDGNFWMAVHRASMIISGMGPTEEPGNGYERAFVDIYALSTLLLTVFVGIIVAPPVVHRVLHQLHRKKFDGGGQQTATAISIDDAVKACRLAGNGMAPGKQPVLTELKREASMVGLAYLNYIYQNDITNQHFCEAMLLMHAQARGAANPFIPLFSAERAVETMKALADVQLVFDYAIARSDPPQAKLEASLATLRKIVA